MIDFSRTRDADHDTRASAPRYGPTVSPPPTSLTKRSCGDGPSTTHLQHRSRLDCQAQGRPIHRLETSYCPRNDRIGRHRLGKVSRISWPRRQAMLPWLQLGLLPEPARRSARPPFPLRRRISLPNPVLRLCVSATYRPVKMRPVGVVAGLENRPADSCISH